MGRVDDALRRAAEAAGGSRGERKDVAPAADTPTTAEPETNTFDISEFRLRTAPQPPPPQTAPAAKPIEFQTHAPLDAVVEGLAEKVVVDKKMPPPTREQYRRLAAALHQQQATSGLQVVMVASAVAGEGKTLTASNLAMTLSESYQRRVLLIDADLRRPTVHDVFKIPGSPGLSEGLVASDESPLVVHDVTPMLTVLTAGRPTNDPTAALTSGRMRRLIDEARTRFVWVVIDTPPVGILTDANLLSAMVDGAVLVVKAGQTPYQLVQQAVHAIGQDRVVGVVLNRAKVSGRGYGYRYYEQSYVSSLGVRA